MATERIIGIDPGAAATGFGVIEKSQGRLVPIAFGEITFSRSNLLSAILSELRLRLGEIINDLKVDEMALESIFLGKSIRSLVTQAHTRGALILTANDNGVPVCEYSPLEIKKAVVGYGKAEKQQVLAMVHTILGISEKMSFDTADALAIAICHAHSRQGKRL